MRPSKIGRTSPSRRSLRIVWRFPAGIEAIPKRSSAIEIAEINSVSMACASSHVSTQVFGAGFQGSDITLVSSNIIRKSSVLPVSHHAVVATLPRHCLTIRRHDQWPRAMIRVSRVQLDEQRLQECHEFRPPYYGRGELLLRVTPDGFHQKCFEWSPLPLSRSNLYLAMISC